MNSADRTPRNSKGPDERRNLGFFATARPDPKGERTLKVALAALFLAASAAPSMANLALIRQGAESGGSKETGDAHGHSLAVGDFNGDGIDDLATGAPWEDVSGVNMCGAVIVNYGSSFGLTDASETLLQSDGNELQSSAVFGTAVAAGDFDDDGYDDLAVGAPGADYDSSTPNVGMVFVYAGSPGGLSYWHYLWQPSGGGSPETNDRFGASLCVAQLNGAAGTNEDLVVGSPGEDDYAGTIFYYTGGSNGLLNGTSGWRKQSSFGGVNEANDQFGYSLAAGQIEGSSYDEIVVGSPFEDVSGVEDAGVAWVILGTSTGPSASSADVITPDEGDLPHSPYPQGWFGMAVSAGRFYGGSYDGVAIGEPGRSYFGNLESGRVVIGKGTSSGLSFTNGNDITLFQDDTGWSLGNEDNFGRVLAAGDYDGSDVYEDLAIGCPSDNANGGPVAAGVISILFGGTNGPGSYGWVGWAQDAWNDPIEQGDRFGASLAFGRFESANRRSLAIGSPGEDSTTGAVYIAAPWRQRQYPKFKNGIAVDCEGNCTYALRPFEEVCIASTTKIMTVLIACERSQLPSNNSRFVNITTAYQVPDWIRNNIGGSLYDFGDEQRVTLRDLLYCCLFPSGNDAAYAIADLLTGSDNSWNGEYDNTVQDFVDEMNDRAAQIGMTRTTFTNPAGLDKGGPHSCAADMALLAQVAMENPLFATVCGSTNYTFQTSALSNSGTRIVYTDSINYGFLMNLQGQNPDFAGLKPGQTPCAKATGVYSAEDAFGFGYAATFGTQVSNNNWTPYINDADAVMDLALARCGGSFAPNQLIASPSGEDTNGEEPNPFRADFGELSTHTGDWGGGAGQLFAPNPRFPTQLDLLRPVGSSTTRCDLELSRSAELELLPLSTTVLGIAPYQSHGPIVLTNHGEMTATVFVTTPQSGTPMVFDISTGEQAIIPAHSGSQQDSWSYQIENPNQIETVVLGISETFGWSLLNIPVGSNPFFTALLSHDAGLLDQAFRVQVRGTDPVDGRTVHVSLHDTNVTVDAPEFEPDLSAGLVTRLLPALPNPFTSSTSIAYELAEAGDLELQVFDAAGRQVRVLEYPAAQAGRGSFEWNGRSDAGHEVSPGVFFYQLSRNGIEQSNGRVVRIR